MSGVNQSLCHEARASILCVASFPMGAEVPARTSPPIGVRFTPLLNPGCVEGSDGDTRPGMEIGATRAGDP